MNGGLLMWSGYTNQREDASDDKPQELLSDVWAFSNPAGTAIKATSAKVQTVTQLIEVRRQYSHSRQF
jgi:hypothetical protein